MSLKINDGKIFFLFTMQDFLSYLFYIQTVSQ